MSYELFIGLRYLKAKRKQTFISVITLISILGVTVGVMALIIVLSVMTGFEEDLREKILGVNAHLVVLELGRGMKNYNEVAQKVKNVKGVIGATSFTYNQAMISSASGVMGVVVRGLDINTVGEVTTLPNKMKQGSLDGLRLPIRETYDTPDTSTPGIVIGKELAKNLSISIGEEINLVSPLGTMTAMGAIPRMARFKVVGIFEFGMYEYDSSIAFISIENSQKFFRQYDVATGIEVKIDNIYKAKEIGDRIQNALGAPFWTRTWMEMNKNLFSALKLEKIAMFIILILIIMVAAFNIISTLIMVVMEKSKDIAILKSMGATSGSIMKIFMIEGLVIGIAGTIIGTSGGVLSCMLLKKYQFIKLPSDVYYISTLPVRMDPILISVIAVAAICITFLATLYPSWQASKLDPVDVIRYE
ncbi:MAG: lipoprotein-releasing ABC transporter permease subunit [Deltaproteobacteria bacterium]|nr:lipoprotein-releasing ABC transporter permease subunit [Deltaproteobacteria bacterium]